METEHPGKQANIELDALRSRVLRMGEQVEQQLIHALDGLASGDISLLDRVIEGGRVCNAVGGNIDEDCAQLMMRHPSTPKALRFVTAMVNTIADLERIGDEAKSIAHTSKHIHTLRRPQLPGYGAVRSAATVTLDMLRRVLEAFDHQEVDAAARIAREEEGTVHSEFRSVVRLLATFMMEGQRTLPASLDTLFVALSIQRIGDHAGNIAEHVVYMLGGRNRRHTRGKEMGLAAQG